MYYFARLARDVEERLVILFRQSKVIGGLYRSLGQEGESVGTAYALERHDAVLPLIRNMGALMTVGVRPLEIFRQYMAKGTSNSRGRDLNIHIVHLPDPGRGRARHRRTDQHARGFHPRRRGDRDGGAGCAARPRVAMAWIGDGATSTGAFHEGLNFAAVQRIPLVVVAEDNKYAYSTPIAKQMAIKRIDERAASYGIPHELVDGNDILAVYDVAKTMVDRARDGQGAQLIGVDTMRMQGHAQHDDARYVPKDVTRPVGRQGSDCPLSQDARRTGRRDREGPRRHRQDDEGLRGERGRPRRRGADARSGDRRARASTLATTTRFHGSSSSTRRLLRRT